MIKVLFVGDKPSKNNYNPEIAFVGTPSYKVLIKWWQILGPIGIAIENSHNDKSLKNIIHCNNLKYRIIALGNNAGNKLTKMGIKHFKLPHPSPRNRKLNQIGYIESELQKCKEYINLN